jgi:hypothetical protein
VPQINLPISRYHLDIDRHLSGSIAEDELYSNENPSRRAYEHLDEATLDYRIRKLKEQN